MTANKSTVINGLLWAFLDQFSSKGISIIVSIILARILSPEDFGMMGLIYFFTAIAQELVDGGLSSSLIRSENADTKDYSTIFVTNVVISFVIYAILFVIAPYFSVYYNVPVLESILKVYGLIFIINAFSTIQLTLLSKELKFRKIMLINIPGLCVGSLVAVWLASKDYGVWSIVYMQLITQIITAIILWIKNKEIKLFFSYAILKKHFDFGFKIMLSSIVNAIFRNLSNIVIGKSYSVKELGYFERARTLSMYPSYVFVGVLSKVFYPVFSKIKDQTELTNAYKNVLNVSFYITFGALLLLAAIAYPIFGLVLGEKWLFAVPFFQLFCLRAAIHPLQVFNLNILKVKGLSNKLLRIEFLNRLLGFAALCIGLFFNLYWLVVILTISDFIAYFNNIIATQNYHHYRLKDQIKDFSPTIAITIIAFLACYAIHEYSGISQLSWTNIGLQASVYIALYLFLSIVFKNKNFLYILATIRSKIPSKK